MMKLVTNCVTIARCNRAKSASCDLKMAKGVVNCGRYFKSHVLRAASIVVFIYCCFSICLKSGPKHEHNGLGNKIEVNLAIKICLHAFILLVLSVQIRIIDFGPIFSTDFTILAANYSSIFLCPIASTLP